MLRTLLLLLFGSLAATAAAAHGTVEDGHEGPQPANHSPSVQEFYWFSFTPARGEDVTVWLRPTPEANLSQVLLNVCRVESYSCRAPFAMVQGQGVSSELWGVVVSWDRSFYRGARTIGFALHMEHGNGTWETSPLEHWPERPSQLPPEATPYYYYTLPEEPRGAPAVLAPATLVLLAWAAVRRRA